MLFETFLEEKRRKYDQLGRTGYSNERNGFTSSGDYRNHQEDLLRQMFHFHDPFDIFKQFMSNSGTGQNFRKFIVFFDEKNKQFLSKSNFQFK